MRRRSVWLAAAVFGACVIIFLTLTFISLQKRCLLYTSVISGATNAVELVFAMLGMMCAWTGLMKIADAGGVTALLCRFFSPLTKIIFPKYKTGSAVLKAISMNITANMLGLGNAATPLGIEAMKQMKKVSHSPEKADNEMVMFVVLNTASVQLIPTFMGTLRAQYGSQSPFDILPAVWISSIVSLFVGILTAKILEGRGGIHG